MEHEKANLPESDSISIAAILKIKNQEITMTFPRAELAKLRELSVCVVSFPLTFPIKHEGREWRFVVFPLTITPELKLEQTGEGILCADEAEAAEVQNEIIKSKNKKSPKVVLVSWKGGFALGTITNERKWRMEYEFLTFDTPKSVSGNLCGFSLRTYKRYLDEPRKLVSEDFLPVVDKKAADEMVRQKIASVRAEAKSEIRIQNMPQVEPALIQSQLKVLSKSYPETVAFFANPNPDKAEAAFAAYQRETFALTGHLSGTLNKSEFLKTAKALKNAARRKNPALDAVEFEIVAGWGLRGYDGMTPTQRFEALRKLGLDPVSPEAIRKMCERLKLPSARKRGASPKSTPNK